MGSMLFYSTMVSKMCIFLNIIKTRKDVGNVDHRKEKLYDLNS